MTVGGTEGDTERATGDSSGTLELQVHQEPAPLSLGENGAVG